jgi:uncharacterized protein (TIGR03067 family)
MARHLCAALAFVVLAAPSAAQTTKAVDLVPDDALGFLLVKDLHQLSDKVDQLAKKLNVEERVSLLELIQKEMGIREGINAKGSAAFIVLKAKDHKSSLGLVVALPVADHEKIARQLGVTHLKDTIAQGEMGLSSGLLAGIGGKGPEGTPQKFPVLVAKRGDFVLLAPPQGRAGLEAVVNSKKSVAATLQPVQDWLAEQDIFGICTDHGVSAGLAMFLQGPGGGVQTSSPGQYAQLKATFAEVEKNVKLIAFGARIDNDGHARLATAVHFQPEGSYARWVAKAEPLGGKLLARFPDQPQLVTALARISAQTTFEGAGKFLFGELPAEKVDALTKELAKLVRQVSEVGVCVYAGKKGGVTVPIKGAAGLSGDPVFLGRVRDAAAFLDDAVDLLRHCHRAERAAARTKVEINYQEKEIGGKPARLITVKPAEGGDGKAGKDRPQVFLLAALDSQTVLGCTLTDAGQAQSTVAKFSKRADRALTANAAMQKTRGLLPNQLQVEVFFDLQAFGILGSSGLSKTPVSRVAPLGFAMRTLPAGLEAQFVIPFDALKAVVDASRAKKEKKQAAPPSQTEPPKEGKKAPAEKKPADLNDKGNATDTVIRPVVILIDAKTKGIPEGAQIKQIDAPKETVGKKALRDVKSSKGRMAGFDREYAVKSAKIALADDTVVECNVLLSADEPERMIIKNVQRARPLLEATSDEGAGKWTSCLGEYKIAIDSSKDRPAKQRDMKRLQGQWRVVSSAIVTPTGAEKQPENEVRNHQVFVNGDQLTYEFNNKQNDRHEGTIRLDPRRKWIDWTQTAGGRRLGTMLGIYEIKGDDLRLFFGVDGIVRPRGFDDVGWLLILKREQLPKNK